ncbi:MAG: alpha-galactosidase, partial [Eubacteriales bacterium]|nr:alpha-galactosidase [Eubacteriales bacterium]
KSQYGTVRVQLGLNPETFQWRLSPGETFAAPEAVLVYGEQGMQSMSEAFHRLYRTRVCRGSWRDRERPIVFNSWEAMYFQVSEEKILRLARQAAELGMEVFVLDDGWFCGRNTDATSLGDWETDREKFPNGLAWLSEQIESMGMKTGIWFEPEMISEKSSLYRKRPEWVIRSRRYRPVPGRCQYVLDLSNPEVCDYLIRSVGKVLREGHISYVKWDMNRHLTDLGSAFLPGERQGELSHRYVLGLYHVLEELTRSFPDVLWEGCSSGGGRYDAGMLYYMPQTWASDNTDAVCRLRIQQGTSMLFPPVTMCSHVSAVPNHQVGRITPLETRFHVAMSGNLGYELDLNRLTAEEKQKIAEQTAFYKKIRRITQFGDYYRLTDFFTENRGGWEFISGDGEEVIVVYVQVLSEPAYEVPVLYLRGLDPEAEYRCGQDGAVFGGDELMYSGMTIPREKSDFSSRMYWFHKINREEN